MIIILDIQYIHKKVCLPFKIPLKFCKIKITHMRRRWGTPQNFFLAFTDELEKQILKKLLKWANKK